MRIVQISDLHLWTDDDDPRTLRYLANAHDHPNHADNLGSLNAVLDDVEAALPAGAGANLLADGQATQALNKVLAPHLPLLLSRSFPLAARAVLTSGAITTEGAKKSLLAVSQFVTSVQEEIADALAELQWRQQQKLQRRRR